jgi:hypothetical protein
MNKYLAQYLFEHETLFVTKPVSELVLSPLLIENPTSVTLPERTVSVEKSIDILPISTQKDIWVVVEALTDESKELLRKILQSVKLSFEEVALFEMDKETESIKQQVLNFGEAPLRVVSFGVGMSKIQPALSPYPYQIVVSNRQTFVVFDDLLTIAANKKDEKKMLWAALKQLFNLA